VKIGEFITFLSFLSFLTCFALHRTHRIGQDSSCHYDYIIANGTLDERVMKKIQTKHSILDHIIDSKSNTDGFNIAETEEILPSEEVMNEIL